MPFPTDPLLARLTIRSLSDPCTVSRADMLALIARAGLNGTPVAELVEKWPQAWMTVRAEVVREMMGRVANGITT